MAGGVASDVQRLQIIIWIIAASLLLSGITALAGAVTAAAAPTDVAPGLVREGDARLLLENGARLMTLFGFLALVLLLTLGQGRDLKGRGRVVAAVALWLGWSLAQFSTAFVRDHALLTAFAYTAPLAWVATIALLVSPDRVARWLSLSAAVPLVWEVAVRRQAFAELSLGGQEAWASYWQTLLGAELLAAAGAGLLLAATSFYAMRMGRASPAPASALIT